MDDQALGVTDVGQVTPKVECLDKARARGPAASQVEGEYGARAAWQIFHDQCRVGTARQARIIDTLHQWMTLQEARHSQRILHVPFHAQWQRFEAEQKQERIER